MMGFLYIDDDKIGEVDFKVTDESMGGIGGNLISNENYKNISKSSNSIAGGVESLILITLILELCLKTILS